MPWAKFRVASVAISALSILVVLFYLLTGGTIFESKVNLFIYIPDATGVSPGSPVRVNGIDVGKVTSVFLTGSSDPNRTVKVTMRIETAHLRSIPLDSYAEVSADTLIGDKFVDISSGKMARHVTANAELRFQPPTDVLKSLDLSQFQRQIRQIDELLTSIEKGEGLVGEFFSGEALYASTVRSLKELDRAFDAATSTTGKVGEALYTDALYREIRKPLLELDESLARLTSGQGESGRLLRDPAQYDELLAQAAALHKSLAAIRSGEGSMGELVTSDAAWNTLNRQVAGAIAAVDRFSTSPAITTPAAYDSLNGLVREMREACKDFRQSPKKYLWMKVF